jgi:hypothetical protein
VTTNVMKSSNVTGFREHKRPVFSLIASSPRSL